MKSGSADSSNNNFWDDPQQNGNTGYSFDYWTCQSHHFASKEPSFVSIRSSKDLSVYKEIDSQKSLLAKSSRGPNQVSKLSNKLFG